MIQVRVLFHLVTQGFSLPQSMTHHIGICTSQLCHGREERNERISPRHMCSGLEMTHYFQFTRLLHFTQPNGKDVG